MKIERIVERQLISKIQSGDFVLSIVYNSDHIFEIKVEHLPSGTVKEKTKPANFRPVFGLDVSDADVIYTEAEAMCEDILDELGIVDSRQE